MRIVGLSAVLLLAAAGPAAAWWQYAEWGIDQGQLAAASGGRAVPCRPGVPVCGAPAGGRRPCCSSRA